MIETAIILDKMVLNLVFLVFSGSSTVGAFLLQHSLGWASQKALGPLTPTVPLPWSHPCLRCPLRSSSNVTWVPSRGPWAEPHSSPASPWFPTWPCPTAPAPALLRALRAGHDACCDPALTLAQQGTTVVLQNEPICYFPPMVSGDGTQVRSVVP